jgi:hypothetical protein
MSWIALLAYLLEGIRFDGTITLGSVIWASSTILLAIIGYRDLQWRIKNLEEWRKEHMIDSDARDQLIKKLSDVLVGVQYLVKESKERRR